MTQQLEPTYLRYIYDGLIKGSIHPENAAELPDGLIGMYEEAFDDRTSVVERQKLLQRFTIWALLKKEVSAAFVAEVLGESEDDIQDFISTYSAWFNSPESGKYQLYHERLKVYLLQKLSEGEVHILHEKLITRLEKAIEEQKADEFEWYGLEYLAIHISVSAMINGDGQKLLNLAYSQTHWQRQLKISKGYSWTKNGLKEVMTWASKYNDDEVIECGLQMVDLHHQEQNAAPQIVALVAEGDFDAALKRIEQFGGSDKEGLQRKFILYMLCLMELTLHDSKDKPSRKVGIEKLLKHLDEQLPVDHSVLNWGEFFSSYVVFEVVKKLHDLEIAYDSLFVRTKYWQSDWFKTLNVVSNIQIDLFVRSAKFIPDAYWKALKLSEIAKLSFTNGNAYRSDELMNEAIIICLTLEGGLKNNLLSEIGESFITQNNLSKAMLVLDEFKEPCQEKITVLARIISKMILNHDSENIKALIDDLNLLIKDLEDNYLQSLCKIELIKIQMQLGATEEAIILAKSIEEYTRVKVNAFCQIIITSKNKAINQELNHQIKELMTQIDDDWEKDIAYSEMIDSLLVLGKFRECEELLGQIKNEYWRNGAILKLSNFCLIENHAREKSLKLLKQLPDLSSEKFEGYITHINFLFLNRNSKQAEKLFHEVWSSSKLIEFEFDRILVQRNLVEIMLSERKWENVSLLFFNQTGIPKGVLTKKFQKDVLFDLLSNYADLKRSNAEKTISEELLTNYIFKSINSESQTLNSFKNLIHLNRIDDALLVIDHVEDLYFKSSLIRYYIQEVELDYDVKNKLINQLVLCSGKVNSVFWKCHSMAENIIVLKSIYSENDLERYIENLIELSLQLKEWFSIKLLSLISAQLFAINLKTKAFALLSKSLELTESLNKDDKEKALLVICIAFVKLENIKEAQKILHGIGNNSNKKADLSLNSKCETLYFIVEVYLSKGERNIAENFIRQIENVYWKNKGYQSLILNLISSDRIAEAIHLSNSIPLTNALRSVWQEIGIQKMIPSYQLQELRIELFEFFKIGEVEAVKLSDITNFKSKQLIFQNKNNFYLLSQCLTKSVIHNLFYQTEKRELTNRYCQTLNIKWALDLNLQLN